MAVKIVNQSKRRRRARMLRNFIFFSFLILFLFISILVVIDRNFQVGEITVSGNALVDGQEIAGAASKILSEKKFFIFSRKNLFLIDANDLSEKLKNQFAAAAEIKTSRNFREKKLEIAFKERSQWAVWCQKESCFYVDGSGVIFRKAPQFLGNLVFKILDKRQESLSFGGRILDENFLEKVKNFIKGAAESRQIAIHSFEIHSVGERTGDGFEENFENENQTPELSGGANTNLLIKLAVAGGWQIIIDSQTDTRLALENLSAILNSEALKARLSKLDYVDLRFTDKSFLKFKN